MIVLVGLDPGRSKCGLVRADTEASSVVEAIIAPPPEIWARLRQWQAHHGDLLIVLGNGTGSRHWREQLSDWIGSERVMVVNEDGSSQEARQRYWRLFPPRNWRAWIPEGLRVPPRALDDLAALVLLERWLRRPLRWAIPQENQA
ncbi:MAG: resolvase [Aphanocapsa feldmannii 277cV]|uniref:Resolvase n=2 Tax=Aphanocapsa feldmannii TaxID=192050 RepID=A0A524RPH5_9CHRO|nr:MAG: resolvase [Aphanocapsa feldmannii 277cV]